jgi:hypothetical protein
LSRQFISSNLLKAIPQSFITTHCQDKRLASLFQPQSQASIISIDSIACYPTGRHARFKGPSQHVPRQFRLGREGNLLWDTGFSAPCLILCPFCWQIQLAIDQGIAALA